MEMKVLSKEERILFEAAAFADVPRLCTKQGIAQPRWDVGDCFVELTRCVTKDEYLAHLAAAETAGWEPCCVQALPLLKVIYTAAFRKGRRILSFAFYDFPPEDGQLCSKLYTTVFLTPEYRTFDCGDLFADLPLPETSSPRDCGEGNFIRTVPEAERNGYDALCAALDAGGWQKTYDNGAGLAATMFTARYTKGARTLTALYAAPSRKLYITVGRGQAPLSCHVKDDPAWRAGFLPGIKTSLHMLELWHFGNSFVIRLKNGHFLISDGGTRDDTPYLIAYLERLVPKGEKPVVEGWFISHFHGDHCGVLMELGLNDKWSKRIVVEGVYASVPSVEMLALDWNSPGVVQLSRRMSRFVRTSSGEPTPFYRLHTGERYYFADITVDVLLSQELLPYKDSTGDLNDTSTWLLFNIEGQKVLLAGDGDKGGMKLLMDNYTSDFMTVDVMSLLHHGWNTRNFFTDYCRVKTMLFTCHSIVPPYRAAETEYLKSKVREWFPWGDGTKKLVFPYHVGEAVCMPPFEWEEHQGEVRVCVPPNVG